MKKRLFAACLALMVTSSLWGCSNKPVNEPEPPAQESAGEAGKEDSKTGDSKTGEAGEKIVIHLMSQTPRSGQGTEGFATGFYNMLDQWCADHPEVEVNLEDMDQTSYQTKINSVCAAGDIPDIFMLKGSWATTFIDNGWVSDLSGGLDADPAWRDGYIENAFEAVTRDEKVYGIPTQSMATGLVFYNSQMWADMGYETFPETWEELLEAVEKFKAAGISTFVLGNKPNWPAESCWMSTLGDRYTGADWTQSILEGSGAKFTDPEFIEALTLFKELNDKGAFNADINSIDDKEEDTVYFNAKAASIVSGTWFIPIIETTAPEDVKNATKLALLPAISGGTDQQNTISGGPAWFLSVGSSVPEEKRELVMDLVKTLTGKEQADITASMGNLTAWADPTYDESKVSPLYTEYNQLMKNAKTVRIYDACMPGSVIETMNVGLQSLLAGEKTPEELANEIQMEQELLQ